MSREQWGHGYWSGYEACRNEEKKLGIKKPTDCDVILSVARYLSFGRTYVSLKLLVSVLLLVHFDHTADALNAIKKCGEKFDCGISDDGESFIFVYADGIAAQKRIDDYCEKVKKIQKQEEN